MERNDAVHLRTARVFLSYKRHAEPDQSLAGDILAGLSSAGHEVFIDQHLTVVQRVSVCRPGSARPAHAGGTVVGRATPSLVRSSVHALSSRGGARAAPRAAGRIRRRDRHDSAPRVHRRFFCGHPLPVPESRGRSGSPAAVVRAHRRRYPGRFDQGHDPHPVQHRTQNRPDGFHVGRSLAAGHSSLGACASAAS